MKKSCKNCDFQKRMSWEEPCCFCMLGEDYPTDLSHWSGVEKEVITIPILEGDELWDLVHAFMIELHERKLIYVSNGTEGDIKASTIVDLLVN